jgi:hypothetical protein
MARPLGIRQLSLLVKLAPPTRFLVLRCEVSRSLEARGLLAERVIPESRKPVLQITSQGLRTLADAMDSGQLGAALDRWRAAPRGSDEEPF